MAAGDEKDLPAWRLPWIRLATGVALTVAFALLTPGFLYLVRKTMDEHLTGEMPSPLNCVLLTTYCLISCAIFWFLYRRIERVADDWEALRYFREAAQFDDAHRPLLKRYPSIHILAVLAMMATLFVSFWLNARIRRTEDVFIERGWPISVWRRELPLGFDEETGIYRDNQRDVNFDLPMHLGHLQEGHWSGWAITANALIVVLVTVATGLGLNRGLWRASRWIVSRRRRIEVSSNAPPLKPQQ